MKFRLPSYVVVPTSQVASLLQVRQRRVFRFKASQDKLSGQNFKGEGKDRFQSIQDGITKTHLSYQLLICKRESKHRISTHIRCPLNKFEAISVHHIQKFFNGQQRFAAFGIRTITSFLMVVLETVPQE